MMKTTLLLIANLVVSLTLQALTTHEADANPTAGAGAPGPGGSNGQVQYRVSSNTFGGIRNATSDGTTLTLTSPKIVTNIRDTNSNILLGLAPVGSAVNNVAISNAASGEMPEISVSGHDANVALSIRPKGQGGFLRIGPDTYGTSGWSGFDLGLEYYQASSPTDSSYGIYVENHLGDFHNVQSYGMQSNLFTQDVSATQDVSYMWAVNGNSYVYLPAGRSAYEVKGIYGYSSNRGLGYVFNMIGAEGNVELFEGSSTQVAHGVQSVILTPRNATTNFLFNGALIDPGPSQTTHATHMFGLYIQDLSISATYPYFLYYDSPGVYYVAGDGTTAYYNPSFAKFGPGTPNYERAIQQWNNNTLEYGTQAGGTGTLRPVTILGSAVSTPDLTVDNVLKLTPRSSPPSSPSEGSIYAGTDHHLYYYNGTAWKQLDN